MLPPRVINLVKRKIWHPLMHSDKPRFCEDLIAHARAGIWSTQPTQEPKSFDLPLPKNTDFAQKFAQALHRQQRHNFAGQHLVCIPEATAAGGFVRLPGRELLHESDWRDRYFLATDISRARFHRHRMRLTGNGYFLDTLFSTKNYGHWLSDELPRLVGALPFLPDDTKFVVSDPTENYKLESLAALNIPRAKLVPVKGYYQIQFERLWYATPANDMAWNPTSVAQVREALIQKFGQMGTPAPRRIYVSRNNVRWKRLDNEEELLPVIRRHGFFILHPQQFTLTQQIETFARASVVMGVYGAGLTNVMFCAPGTKLIEFQDDHFAPRPWYWKWASLLGLDYLSLTGSMLENRMDYLDTRFRIAPDALDQWLKQNLPSVTTGT